MFSILFISNCKKEPVAVTDYSFLEKEKIATRFFNIRSNADPELKALAEDIKKQDSLQHFLTSFVNKNGYPVWDKVYYQTKINNQAIVYSNSTKNTDDVKLSMGLFLIPCVDDKTNHVKSYIVVKKHQADTYTYQLYNREELNKVHVPDSLKSALVGTQAVFGYFEKEINHIDEINITNPENITFKNVQLSFIEQPKNKNNVKGGGLGVQESICQFATYYIQVTVDTSIGKSTELWEVTIKQCQEIPSDPTGSTNTWFSDGLGGTSTSSNPDGTLVTFYGPSPYNFNIPLTADEFLIEQLKINDIYQQGFLRNHIEISTELLRYLTLNGFTQENEDFIRWAVQYLYENPNVNFEEFKNKFLFPEIIIANPNSSNWTDPDNVVLFDPDQQTTYQEYQDNQPWPTINRIIPFDQFVPMRRRPNGDDESCLVLSREQLGKAGYTCSGYLPQSQTFQCYTESSGANLSRTKQGITYLIDALQKGIPVLIAVDNRPGTPSSLNLDNSTDHFVVVVGMGTDSNGKKYFQFVDSSTSNPSQGASYANRLFYDSSTGKISGKTQSPYGSLSGFHDYIVTQIRKSIKK